MDIRESRSGISPAFLRWVDEFNSRHPWSHNDHFHAWIGSRLPSNRRSALDVGCGQGELLRRLAMRFDTAEGIDIDCRMCDLATRHIADLRNATVRLLSLDEIDDRYDVITMVAVLHHLDMEQTFHRVRQLLKPDGRLLVVGLARVESMQDSVWDLASGFANPIMGLFKHPRTASGPVAPPFPVTPPTATFAEIKQCAQRQLPGARMHRRLFFRYTLEWTRV